MILFRLVLTSLMLTTLAVLPTASAGDCLGDYHNFGPNGEYHHCTGVWTDGDYQCIGIYTNHVTEQCYGADDPVNL